MAIVGIIDMDDAKQRATLINSLRTLRGEHRVEIKRYRVVRSKQQNDYLWSVVYPAFVQFRNEQGEDFESDDAHRMFGLKFLRKPIIDKETGEILGQTIRSTTTLDVAEFSEYVEKIIAWLADYGIEVPPAERDPRKRAEMRKARAA